MCRCCFFVQFFPRFFRFFTNFESKKSFTLFSIITSLVLSSCTIPSAALLNSPIPPLGSTSLLGQPGRSTAAVVGAKRLSLDDVQRCLGDGHEVYGLTLQNANVRSAPDVNVCRVGRIPEERLVRITRVITPSAAPIASAKSGVGYNEDIQPIFLRNCNSCHSAIVQQKGLQVTTYTTVMKGSLSGPVVAPGDAAASLLWQQLESKKMPMIGELSQADLKLIKAWIDGGALERRHSTAAATRQVRGTWLEIAQNDFDVTPDSCAASVPQAQHVVSSELILPVACGARPSPSVLAQMRSLSRTTAAISGARFTPQTAASVAQGELKVSSAAEAPVSVAAPQTPVLQSGLQATALGLPPPSDGDPYLTPRGGFCIEQRLAQNQRGITALAFRPDGTLFLGLDQNLAASDVDTMILFDAFHPSRSLAVYNSVDDGGFVEILTESSRITGLAYANGAIYLNRAGEVGRVPDGGGYEKLAGGFAVNSQYFHANDGLVVANGWIYVSTGGMLDGYSDGPIVGMDEGSAQQIVSSGNPWAARIVAAPLDALLTDRNINLFQTVARGVRNPYGLTMDPAGRLWFTDNGATNVPEEVSAGDEVNMLAPGAAGDDAAPYYGFPLALSGNPPNWYTPPVTVLPNTSAPTGITWAYGTIFFGVYGRDPGLYRLGRSGNGAVIAERIMAGWPILAVTTAPDGALWIGMGNGNLFRMTPGC
jgi:hypothetical protein